HRLVRVLLLLGFSGNGSLVCRRPLTTDRLPSPATGVGGGGQRWVAFFSDRFYGWDTAAARGVGGGTVERCGAGGGGVLFHQQPGSGLRRVPGRVLSYSHTGIGFELADDCVGECVDWFHGNWIEQERV